ncbi:MAG: hypothetical protein MR858_08975, partial [Shigella flexneri]|nr:hypothetical protein [Shigella flexneri]
TLSRSFPTTERNHASDSAITHLVQIAKHLCCFVHYVQAYVQIFDESNLIDLKLHERIFN